MRTIGYQDVSNSVSAAGTTQSDATALIASFNEITTVASGAGVILASLSQGDEQSIFNAGANALKVYPPSAMKINALSTNSAMLLATNTGCVFKWVSPTRVFGLLSA